MMGYSHSIEQWPAHWWRYARLLLSL